MISLDIARLAVNALAIELVPLLAVVLGVLVARRRDCESTAHPVYATPHDESR